MSYLQLSAAVWSYLKLSEAIWSYVELNGAIGTYLELSGPFWTYLDLSEAELSGVIWNYLGLLRSYMELSSAIQAPLGSPGILLCCTFASFQIRDKFIQIPQT